MFFEPMLKNGTLLNNSIRIIELIGAGGQGEVYKVEYHKQLLALKWYYPKSGTPDLKKSLLNLISKGSPDDNFLWPIALVEHVGSFGYLMELRPKDYRSLQEWVQLDFDMEIEAIAKACFQLTNAFHKLHAKGFSYKDISFGNLFIEPINGDILICDNDNVTANGMNVNGLLGTPKFMAPEIVMGGKTPNTETDQFSLAILLFYFLFISHPLEGAMEATIKCMDQEANRKLYGRDALFIYDKNSDTNRPIPGIHDNAIMLWNYYPSYIKELFHKTFTIGIKHPTKRTRESEWRSAFFKMYNSIIKCPHCGMENFYDQAVLKEKGSLEPCVLCKERYNIPPRIRIDDHIILLEDKKHMFVSHIKFSEPSSLTPISVVNKINMDYILTNLSKDTWKYTMKTQTIDVLPNQQIVLVDGGIVDFGGSKGEIRF